MARAVQHLFLAERERLFDLQQQQALQHFRYVQQAAGQHLFRILFEPRLPVCMEVAASARQERQHARDFGVASDLAQSDGTHVGKGHHHGHAAVDQTQEIEFFELGAEGTTADVLDGADSLVGVHHLVTDFEGHTENPSTLNHRC